MPAVLSVVGTSPPTHKIHKAVLKCQHAQKAPGLVERAPTP